MNGEIRAAAATRWNSRNRRCSRIFHGRKSVVGSGGWPNVVMGLEGVGINTTPPVITDGAVLAIDGGVKIGTHLLKSTNQGLDVAGVRLDDGDLISNTSISDLVLQRVGEDHAVVLVSYDETSQSGSVQGRSDPSFSIVPESYIRLSTEHQISKWCGHW
jgi:hypothetical protein